MQPNGRLGDQAKRDLKGILRWMAKESFRRAERFKAHVYLSLDRLPAFPEIGRAVPELGDGRRIWRVWDYLLIYRVAPDEVVVERILHGARDLDALFDDDAP